MIGQTSGSAWLAVWTCIATLACGCTTNNGSTRTGQEDGGTEEAATGDAAISGAVVSATIGAGGGQLNSADGILSVQIPAGAIASPTTFSVQQVSSPAAGSIGPTYDLEPSGSTFALPATLTFQYGLLQLAANVATPPGIGTFVNGSWSPVPSAVDANAQTVSASIAHLSTWALVHRTGSLPNGAACTHNEMCQSGVCIGSKCVPYCGDNCTSYGRGDGCISGMPQAVPGFVPCCNHGYWIGVDPSKTPCLQCFDNALARVSDDTDCNNGGSCCAGRCLQRERSCPICQNGALVPKTCQEPFALNPQTCQCEQCFGCRQPPPGAVGPICEDQDALCPGSSVDTSNPCKQCVRGQCVSTCPTGETCCPGAGCKNTMVALDNCGACGRAVPDCWSCCGGNPTNVQEDPLHCQDCRVSCGAGEVCIKALCQCPPGWSRCNDTCINTDFDPNNCGGCGNVCDGGGPCVGGKCGCAGTTTACGGQCVDLRTDSQNCGSCGNACPSTTTCRNGGCTCPGGQTPCTCAVGQFRCTGFAQDPPICCQAHFVCSAGIAGVPGPHCCPPSAPRLACSHFGMPPGPYECRCVP
jgi:hypothetical protein